MKEDMYYDEIKNYSIRNEVYKGVKDYSKNRSDLETYYTVGELLSEANKNSDENVIKEFSKKLTEELDKKYSEKELNYMIKFYEFQKKYHIISYLSWKHWVELLSLDDINTIKFYIYKCETSMLTVKQLRNLIKQHEYEKSLENTKNEMIN